MVVDIKRYLRKTGSFYHVLSALYIYLHRRSELCEIPIEICVNPMGFSFAQGGWNYLIEQLREFDQSKGREITDSILFKFHDRYQPNDMSEIPASAGLDVAFKPPLSIYPWGSFDMGKTGREDTVKDALTSRFYGPSTRALVEKDMQNLLDLYNSIKTNGYRPWNFGNAFIGGVFLEKADGKKKYVVLQGNHRTAVLAHLGYKNILTRYLRGYHRCIKEREMKEWFHVKSGECNEKDALAYLNAFFLVDGTERARAMGFLA